MKSYAASVGGPPEFVLIPALMIVDSLLTGTTNAPAAASLYQHAKALFAPAHINLWSWNSNSDTFHRALPADDVEQRDVLKVLGLIWNRLQDTLTIPVPNRHQLLLAKTKREVLHGVAVTYDPLGLFIPITIRGKASPANTVENTTRMGRTSGQ